ncbi:MAG TPA: flavin reductase family protein [Candidatus Thermoplasmatota archaeon]|nr:flavin reductase family protein [Candidatus Thermoplasmatota archaeon]
MTTDDASAALTEVRSTLLFIGTKGPGGDHFMLANWGTQASFDPWRYVILLKKTSHTLANAKAAKSFTVNLLDAPQKALVTRLMKAHGDGEKGEAGPSGAPRLPQAYAGFDCKVLDVLDVGGDHALVVADVLDGWKRDGGPALTVQDAKLSYAG